MKRDTQAKKKILNFLLDDVGEKFYLTRLARETGVSDSTIHQILEKTKGEGIVQKEKLGNLSLYFINPLDPVVKQMKVLRTTELLRPLIEKLRDFSQKVILYGSCSRGEDTKESDIDLFILTNEGEEVKRVLSKYSGGGKRIQTVIKNFNEWVEHKEKDNFFYGEIKNGLTLWEANEP
ncbi:MAG: nucleotidyltransferase domain-containing protein [bacterium]|nr:nucleotidyltransferase domain-containing protein [bacterium]